MEQALDSVGTAPVPDGLQVEPWSRENDEESRSVRNEAYRDNWGALPMPLESWQNKVTNQTFRPTVSFLLRDVATGVRDAHFMVIGTLPARRNRGVASALIGHALRAAADQGYDRAVLNVDSANPFGALKADQVVRASTDEDPLVSDLQDRAVTPAVRLLAGVPAERAGQEDGGDTE